MSVFLRISGDDSNAKAQRTGRRKEEPRLTLVTLMNKRWVSKEGNKGNREGEMGGCPCVPIRKLRCARRSE